ncbi:hypothetical protein D4740_02295 [Actinomyces sp. 2119]|uniref:hypothetical protein n=1 Tax=Actinomyces sp. 2119 TaxID=2321393 RepID=UPI000E6B6CD0|nr:hypothetical protein [Actinomyces sp. 2119]RJF43820.1 hypothetical protein D4740_02295 [Actinomyces sp. 2119]
MDVLRAEVRKAVTLPYTWLTVMATLALTLLVALVLANRSVDSIMATDIDALLSVPDYLAYGVITLGVLAGSTEYQGGEIRTSLTAVPRRTSLLAAKYASLTVLAAGLSLVSMVVAVGVMGLAFEARVWPLVLRGAAYLVVVSLLSFPLGLLVRSTTGALTSALMLLVIAPLVLTPVAGWSQWLPTRLGDELLLTKTRPPGAAATMAALSAWVVVTSAAGAGRFCLDDS